LHKNRLHVWNSAPPFCAYYIMSTVTVNEHVLCFELTTGCVSISLTWMCQYLPDVFFVLLPTTPQRSNNGFLAGNTFTGHFWYCLILVRSCASCVHGNELKKSFEAKFKNKGIVAKNNGGKKRASAQNSWNSYVCHTTWLQIFAAFKKQIIYFVNWFFQSFPCFAQSWCKIIAARALLLQYAFTGWTHPLLMYDSFPPKRLPSDDESFESEHATEWARQGKGKNVINKTRPKVFGETVLDKGQGALHRRCES